MVMLSFIIHLIIIIAFIGKPPDTSKKIYYSPVYSVNLVELPPGVESSKKQGPARGKSKVSLWKGPSPVSSQFKTPRKRAHTMLTISNKDRSTLPTPTTKTSGEKKPALGTESSAQEANGQPAGTVPGSPGFGGTSPYEGGTQGVSAANLRFSRYYQAVWSKIKSAWILPRYGTTRKHLEAIVVIKINRDGRILNIDFEKKSGDSNLDRSVIRAIKKADPLPHLPADFRENYLELGIRFIPDSGTL
jgi:TonB family protein